MIKHDVLILGGGIASLTAAKYLQQMGIDYKIICKILGGNLFSITNIYNFPSYEMILGSELATKMVEQTDGDRIDFNTVTKYKDHVVTCEDGTEYYGKAIILATGTDPIKLDIETPDNSTFYCVICDGYRMKNKDCVVLGGSESAVQASLFLYNICKSVTIACRKPEMKISEHSKRLLKSKDNIFIMPNREIKSIEPVGDRFSFVFNNVGKTESNDTTTVIADGCFVTFGSKPVTDFLKDSLVYIDEKGYVLHGSNNYVNETMSKYSTGTTEDGVFVAGDVSGEYRQLVVASASGCSAALDVIDYLKRSN